MLIPIKILILLPKRFREKYVQHRWDLKTDQQIRVAFHDATEWIEISKGMFGGDCLNKIARDCKVRLDKYILPQMQKRGIKHGAYGKGI